MHALRIRLRRSTRLSRLMQIGVILGLWLAGEAIVRVTHLPLPGAIMGMALTLALLASGRLSQLSLRRGADWFLAQMLLFFVPAVPAVIDHHELIGLVGLKVLLVILVGTAAVMGVTALTVDLGQRWMMRHGPADPRLG